MFIKKRNLLISVEEWLKNKSKEKLDKETGLQSYRKEQSGISKKYLMKYSNKMMG